MSVYTNFEFRNANDLAFIKAKNGSQEEREEWEDLYGPVNCRPGAPVDGAEDVVEETDEEYGGWILAVADIPANVTHVVITRG